MAVQERLQHDEAAFALGAAWLEGGLGSTALRFWQGQLGRAERLGPAALADVAQQVLRRWGRPAEAQ